MLEARSQDAFEVNKCPDFFSIAGGRPDAHFAPLCVFETALM